MKKIYYIEDICPAILILPGAKREGLDHNVYNYLLTIGWSIHQDKITDNESVVEYVGISETIALGQLIQECIDELFDNAELGDCYVKIEPVEFYPQFPGRMDLTINLPVVIGYELDF